LKVIFWYMKGISLKLPVCYSGRFFLQLDSHLKRYVSCSFGPKETCTIVGISLHVIWHYVQEQSVV